VIVTGRLKQRSFETREGEKRTVSRSRSTRSAPRCGTQLPGQQGQPQWRRGGGFGSGSRQAPAPASAPAEASGGSGEDPWGSARHRAPSAAATTNRLLTHELQTSKKEKERHTWPSPRPSGARLRKSRSKRANASSAPKRPKHRLQRHHSAAHIHQRAGQDPGAPCDR